MTLLEQGVAFALDRIESEYTIWRNKKFIKVTPDKIEFGIWARKQRERAYNINTKTYRIIK